MTDLNILSDLHKKMFIISERYYNDVFSGRILDRHIIGDRQVVMKVENKEEYRACYVKVKFYFYTDTITMTGYGSLDIDRISKFGNITQEIEKYSKYF